MELVDADRVVRRIFVEGTNYGDFAGVAEHVSDSYVGHRPILPPDQGQMDSRGESRASKLRSIEINVLASNDGISRRFRQGHG